MSQSAAATLANDDDKNAVYKRITLRLIPFIFICYLFNYLDRVNVGFAKLQMLDALKLCRRPSVCPDSCMIRSFSSGPTNHSGSPSIIATFGFLSFLSIFFSIF